MGTNPTCPTCSSESVASAKSTALRAASSASSEPSVASRILVGKMLIAALSSPAGTPSKCLYQSYQIRWLSARGRRRHNAVLDGLKRLYTTECVEGVSSEIGGRLYTLWV